MTRKPKNQQKKTQKKNQPTHAPRACGSLWNLAACGAVLSETNAGSEPDVVAAAGKRQLPGEAKIAVMELTPVHAL